MRWLLVTMIALVSIAGCHPGPVLGKVEPGRDGTIAGVVTTAESKTAVGGRTVTAVEAETGARHDTKTGLNGGYSIKVPEGIYRLELELRTGETLAKQPGEVHVSRSDLDPRQDFVV